MLNLVTSNAQTMSNLSLSASNLWAGACFLVTVRAYCSLEPSLASQVGPDPIK